MSAAVPAAPSAQFVPEHLAQALEFLHRMFVARKYQMNTKVTMSLEHVQIKDAQGKDVMALLWPCAQSDAAYVKVPQHSVCNEPNSQAFVLNVAKGLGLNFVRDLIAFARSHAIARVVLITDNITAQATKTIYQAKLNGRLEIQHFTYQEAGRFRLHKHKYQPLSCEVLAGAALRDFIASRPRYALELAQRSHDDALVRYFGFRVGEIIVYTDRDTQCGEYKEFCLVVEKF